MKTRKEKCRASVRAKYVTLGLVSSLTLAGTVYARGNLAQPQSLGSAEELREQLLRTVDYRSNQAYGADSKAPGEGKCGDDTETKDDSKKGDKDDSKEDKSGEGKCGEGKCGD